MDRQTVSELLAELDMPPLIDSFEEAAWWAPILCAGNAKFNMIYFRATSTFGHGMTAEPYLPGEEQALDEGLDFLHALQAQALGWHIAKLIMEEPEVRGLHYLQSDCKTSPTRHSTEIAFVAEASSGAWVPPGAPFAAFAARAKAALDALPDLTAYPGRDRRWELWPKPATLREAAMALISRHPSAMTPFEFARWESAMIDRQSIDTTMAGKRPRI